MFKISQPLLIILSAIFLALTANVSFFQEVEKIYPLADNVLFLASVMLLLVATLTFTLSFFSIALPTRMVVSVLVILAAVTGHFTDAFGSVIDSVMIENILQTDTGEVGDLLSRGLVIRVLLLGVAAVAAIWWLPVKRLTILNKIKQNGITAVVALLVMVVTIFSFSEQYAVVFREHKSLRTYINPLMPIYSTVRFAKAQIMGPESTELSVTAGDAHIPETDSEHELIILVVGETARRDHFSLNGYARQTNPELEKEKNLVSYGHISSCGTATAVSVPCMFSASHREDFSIKEALHHENLLDILKRAGVSVLWRDNNSSSKGVADRVVYENFKTTDLNPICDTECRDIGMLDGLQDYIDGQSGDVLIVLHQMGNHGPAYFKRYPPEFEHFTPACHSLDLSECSNQEIINAYDNAILYTDYFLSKVIDLLKKNTPKYETAMLYVSDHGESLGEHGIYLHGMPYMMAPKEQIEVPVVLWLSDAADIELQEAFQLKDKQSSHDAIFDSVLMAFEVESNVINTKDSLFEVAEE